MVAEGVSGDRRFMGERRGNDGTEQRGEERQREERMKEASRERYVTELNQAVVLNKSRAEELL